MSTVEDAIKVTENIVGTITREQWHRFRGQPEADLHVVRPQPAPKSVND